MADEFCINNDLLISLVEQRPVLWEKTLELYKNRVATQTAWKEIMVLLNPKIELRKEKTRRAFGKLVIQRWTHIRDNYHRSCKKIRDQKIIGSKRSKPYVYSKQLTFLKKIFPLKTENNHSDEDDQNEECNSQDEDKWDINFIDTNNLATKNSTIKPISEKSAENDENLKAKIIKFIDTYSNSESRITNRHLSFFNGILPTLDDFEDNEVIEFQMGVLQLLKEIKSNRQHNETSHILS